MAFQTHRTEWELVDSVLIYCPKKFVPHSNVMIIELEDCLIKKISRQGIYHKIVQKDIAIYDQEFFHKLSKLSSSCSIVILSNAIFTGPSSLDLIKTKLEIAMEKLGFEYLAFFATMPNRFSKPHTGLFQLLKGYFKQLGTPVQCAMMVSNNAGRIYQVGARTKVDTNDTDRAFASNCDIVFQTVNEFMERTGKEDFNWNNMCLPPEIRIEYLEKIGKYENPSVFKEIAKSDADVHIILLWGAPRCGKTTYANNLVRAWDSSDYGDNHAIQRLGLDMHGQTARINKAKKLLEQRISIIIDGHCHTSVLRTPFEQIAKEFKANIIYIELNPGIYMADFFNHWAIETSQNVEECIVPENQYRSYNGYLTTPNNTLIIVPEINLSSKQLKFRY